MVFYGDVIGFSWILWDSLVILLDFMGFIRGFMGLMVISWYFIDFQLIYGDFNGDFNGIHCD